MSFKGVLQSGSLPRVLNSAFKTEFVGYCPSFVNKTYKPVVHRTVNLGISLSGQSQYGEVAYEGRHCKCRYPYAFVEIPGSSALYVSEGVSEIFYFSYSSDKAQFLETLGLELRSEAWEIKMASTMSLLLSNILDLAADIYRKDNADKLDMLCGAMLSEIIVSRLSQEKAEDDAIRTRIVNVHETLTSRYMENIDFEELAAENGLTLRTLRRHWDRYYPMPMKRLVMIRRMDEARWLLAEGCAPIGKIAKRCGFENPLYFSRQFHEMVGLTPSEYRKSNRSQMSSSLDARPDLSNTSLKEK